MEPAISVGKTTQNMISTFISMAIEDAVFYTLLCISWTEFFWSLYLSWRQLRVYKQCTYDNDLLGNIVDKTTFEKARLYGLDKSQFSIFQEICKHLISTVGFCYLFYFHVWKVTCNLIDGEIWRSVIFMTLLSLFSTVVDLPFSLHYTFSVEERHGFNKMTFGFFCKDFVKKLVIGQLISMPLFAIMIAVIRWAGDMFFMYLWLFATVVMLFLMTIYPDYIAPLFDKYTPLPDGDLKTSIEALAASLKFPLKKLYLVDGSKRSAHSNAYFYGLFNNKRIVLFDTLLQQPAEAKPDSPSEEKTETKQKGCSDGEILAILGHELGHWKLNHVTKNIVLSQINLLVMFIGLNLLIKYQPLYSAFGFYDEQPICIGLLIITSYVFSPYNTVLSFLMTILSRYHEFEADHFAKKLGRAEMLRSALVKLNNDNLGFPIYDWLYSSWHHSHPTLLQRLEALEKTS